MRLPLASAQVGKSAADGESWVLPDAQQPLAGGRDLNTMANQMYNPNPTVGPFGMSPGPARDAAPTRRAFGLRA